MQKRRRFFGRMKEAFTKRLKYLQPANASNRVITSTSPSLEKAYTLMSQSQDRFNSEREKLRQGLHTSIVTPYDSLISISCSKPVLRSIVPREITPEIISKSSKLTLHSKSVPKFSQKKLEKLEDIFENCEALRSQNQSFLSKIPEIRKSVKKTLKNTEKLTYKVSHKERLLKRIKNNYN
jgi:hypothetical protein